MASDFGPVIQFDRVDSSVDRLTVPPLGMSSLDPFQAPTGANNEAEFALRGRPDKHNLKTNKKLWPNDVVEKDSLLLLSQ